MAQSDLKPEMYKEAPDAGKPLTYQVEQVRLTLFAATVNPAASLSWEALTGQRPGMTQEQPAQNIRQSVGPFLGGQLALSVQMNRLDIILSAVSNVQSFGSTLAPATLGSYEQIATSMKQFHPKWLSLVDGSFERIAISVTVNRFTSNPDETVREFNSKFPGLGFGESDVRDLLLQFNKRKRLTGYSADKINVVQKWIAAQLQVLSFGALGAFPPATSVFDCLRLELDANTPPDVSLNASGTALSDLSTKLWTEIDQAVLEG